MQLIADLLYFFAELAGYNAEKLSPTRIVIGVILGSLFGLAVIGGGILGLAQWQDTASMLIAIALLLFGAAVLGADGLQSARLS